MWNVWQIYKRFFGGLKLVMFLALLIVAAESSVPYIVAALGRYTVDEILELGLPGPKNDFAEIERTPQHRQRLEESWIGAPRPGIWDGQGEIIAPPVEQKVTVTQDRVVIAGDGRVSGAELKEQIILKRGKGQAQKIRLLLWVFGITIAVYLLHSGAKVIHKYMLGWVGEKVVFRLRRALHTKLQQLQMTYHDQHEKGRLMARVMDDVVVVRRTSVHLSTSLTVNIFMLLVGIVVLLLIDVKMAMVSFLALPAFAVVYTRLKTRMKQLWQGVARQRAGMYGLVADRLASPETVKSFGQERRESIRLFARARDLLTTELRLVWLSGFLGLWVTVVHGLCVATVLGMGMLLVKSGTLSIGYLLFFYGSFGLMFMPVKSLCMLIPALQRFRVSADRVMEILEEPVTIYDDPAAIDLPIVAGLIRLKDVGLRYDGIEEEALKGITLDIEPGQRICLMGPSGAGKTSLANLLLRLYEPTAGAIRLDGRDLREINISSLRDHVGYVPQDTFLFTGSVRDNIRYGNLLAEDQQVEDAAKAAELHDFIITLPEKYDTIVGERGVTLSGGQRQRVSLARALLTDPRVLILDDCTSALDAITEAKIVKTLRTALAGRTTIIITHRVSMSSRADLVVVLKDGTVVEVGTHDELLQKEGIYHDLVIEQLAERTSKPSLQVHCR